MKRYLIPIMLAILVLSSGIVSCSQASEPIPLPDTPRRTEQQMTYVLYDYFFEEFGFNTYWARPLFLPNEQWTALYNGEGNWID